MKNFKTCLASTLLTATVTTATAGGILTNTNQSIDFLRNPARDAAIGIDGVYSNPAGVAFLPEGFHLGLNWQYAHQTRTVTSTDNNFALGRKNNGQTSKVFEGVADAPIIPSIQAAWNKGNWSMQMNFSVPGGGGKCEFAEGLGSFERVVGGIAAMLRDNGLGATGYDMNSMMTGRQYYYGLQLGTAYKINHNLSVYGGLRLLYGDATYRARISNIQVATAVADGQQAYVDFGSYLEAAIANINQQKQQGQQALAAGLITAEQAQVALAKADGAIQRLNMLQKYSEGVNLLCNQTGLGIAPIIGIDYKIGNINLAAKYEFKTQIRMTNESTVFEASEIESVNKYKDSEKVNEDAPALLTVGAQWAPVDGLRLNLGYHHYFDKQANWYNDSQKKLDHNTNEFLAGVEWDITDRLTISAGGQMTRYGLTDEYMSDISFVVNSASYGFGFNYKVSNKVKMKVAYFQTDYDNYNRTTPTQDTFTRTNRVLGLGCDIDI